METAIEIAYDEIREGYVGYPNGQVWYKFTASSPDCCPATTMFTMGSHDTYGELYDESGELLACCDDSNRGTNFKIVQNLENGKNYFLRVTSSGSAFGDFSIKITNDVLVEDITVNMPECTIRVGESFDLNTVISPSNATNKNLTYIAECCEIVDVDCNGRVTGIGEGESRIYVETQDGSQITEVCNVIVIGPMVTCVNISPAELMLNVGETYTLSATVFPENAADKSVIWTSSDCTIAEVNENTGCVTGKSVGTTTICAIAQDGSNTCGCCTIIVVMNDSQKEVPALITIKDCNVRIDTKTEDAKILEINGHDVVLRKEREDRPADKVQLLNLNKVSGDAYNDDTGKSRNDWYQILYDGMMVYVTADSFEESTMIVDCEQSGTSVRVNTGGGNLYVRCTPSTEKTEIGRFSNGITVILTNDIPQNDEWYAVYGRLNDGSYSYGWCFGEYLEFEENTEDVEEQNVPALITLKECRVRSNTKIEDTNILKKSDNSEVRLQVNDTVRLLQETKINGGQYTSGNSTRNDWYKIEYNNQECYVTADSFARFDLWYYKVEASPINNISQNGITMLKSWEMFKPSAYKASSSEPNYTIGYGHVIQDGTQSVTINGEMKTKLSKDEANILLMEDLKERFILNFNIFLKDNHITLNQRQYDACILDCFQRGENIWRNQYQAISIFIKNNQDFGDYEKVLNAFCENGSDAGRNDRREKEANLFVYGVYNIKQDNL